MQVFHTLYCHWSSALTAARGRLSIMHGNVVIVPRSESCRNAQKCAFRSFARPGFGVLHLCRSRAFRLECALIIIYQMSQAIFCFCSALIPRSEPSLSLSRPVQSVSLCPNDGDSEAERGGKVDRDGRRDDKGLRTAAGREEEERPADVH